MMGVLQTILPVVVMLVIGIICRRTGLISREGIGALKNVVVNITLPAVLLNPFAPHITEELFEIMGFGGPISGQSWVQWDEARCVEDTVEIAVQINGKVRAKLKVAAEISSEDAIAAAKADETIAAQIAGKTIVKELYVKGRLVNIVAK